MAEIWLIYSTFAHDDEAVSIARALLDAKLIACANIHAGVTSLYRWEGEIKQEKEVGLTAKTDRAHVDAAMALIKKHHSYTLPCIVATPVTLGFAPFLEWVSQELA
jgi:periplasmic divalent cation tolerance protein